LKDDAGEVEQLRRMIKFLKYEHIHFVPYESEELGDALVRAGAEHAHSIIIPNSPVVNEQYPSGAMRDSVTIKMYHAVLRLLSASAASSATASSATERKKKTRNNKGRVPDNVFVVLENKENGKFLLNTEYDISAVQKGMKKKEENYYLHPMFAAGAVLAAGSMNTIVTQAWFIEDIVKIVNDFVKGSIFRIPSQILGQKGVKYQTAFYLLLHSGLLLLGIYRASKEKVRKRKKIGVEEVKETLAGILRHHHDPENEGDGNAGAVGVDDEDSAVYKFRYVVTQPPPEMELKPKDYLFVMVPNDEPWKRKTGIWKEASSRSHDTEEEEQEQETRSRRRRSGRGG